MKGFAFRADGDSRFYAGVRGLVYVLFGFPSRYQVSGAGAVPLQGAAILAVTHKSNLDPTFAGMAVPRPIRYMAKKELFDVPVLASFLRGMGTFPVDRGAGDRHALELALKVLEDGELLLMFPEGTRFRDDEVHEFLSGIGMIAVRSGAPVLPVAVKGTLRRSGLRRLVPLRVRTMIGAPVDLSGLEGRRSVVYQEAAQRIHAAVEDVYGRL